ncbi:MAG: RidA family protein [Dehalococcoidia bacterium]
MQGTPVNVEGIYSYRDNLKISHAVKTGNTIHISGQVALDPDGNVVGKGDIETQADYIWGNVQKVLEAAGSGLDDVVKIFQFVVGHENFAGMSAARRRVLGADPLPCSTAIVVSALVRPDLLLEVDVIAVIKG